jgi:hypothetical protein
VTGDNLLDQTRPRTRHSDDENGHGGCVARLVGAIEKRGRHQIDQFHIEIIGTLPNGRRQQVMLVAIGRVQELEGLVIVAQVVESLGDAEHDRRPLHRQQRRILQQ